MPWYVTVYELLLQVSLAGCVLLALATIAVTLLREPARKIRVIELAMSGLLALPMVVLIPGYPRVALLPAMSSLNAASEARLVPREVPDAKPTPVQILALPEDRAPADPITVAPRVSAAPPVRIAHQREPSAVAAPTLRWRLPTDYRFWIVLFYLSGVGILLLWSLVGLVAMRRLIRGSQPADAATHCVLHSITGNTNARVRLLVSPRTAQPCAFGWLRPTIVLPENIVLPDNLVADGNSAAIRFAIAHEWSHVSRGDVGVWTLSGVARLLHFQQPLVWLLRQHLRRSQDYLADAAAAGTATPEDYAEFLTTISHNYNRTRLAPGLGIVSRRSDLHRRVVMLVEKQGSLERVPPKRWSLVILVVGLLAVATVASLRAEPQGSGNTLEKTAEAVPPKNKSDGSISGDLNKELDSLIERDPKIARLQQELEKHEDERDRMANEPSPTPETLAAITKHGQSILRLAEQIRERAMELRTEMIGSLKGSRPVSESQGGPAQRSTTSVVRPLEAQTQRFMLGEGVLAAQNFQASTSKRRAPFSGKIRPGDILNIEIVGGFPMKDNPSRTVEPDGNVALSPAYGIVRIAVGGKTLVEAGKKIEDHLKGVLRDPRVLVTYAGHDPDVIAEGEAAVAAPPAAEPVILAPLDTIQIRLGAKSQNLDRLNGIYLIEPDGRVALIDNLGRIKLAGLTESEASAVVRAHVSAKHWERTAPPSISVIKRGLAVFPADKPPAADYRVKIGDQLLINTDSAADGGSYEVGPDGTISGWTWLNYKANPVPVAGLTLDEAQLAVRDAWKVPKLRMVDDKEQQFQDQSWLITVGGWHEEADPQLIDRLGEPNDPRVQQLERELQQIKTMIHAQR